jgi:hypothetical protein
LKGRLQKWRRPFFLSISSFPVSECYLLLQSLERGFHMAKCILCYPLPEGMSPRLAYICREHKDRRLEEGVYKFQNGVPFGPYSLQDGMKLDEAGTKTRSTVPNLTGHARMFDDEDGTPGQIFAKGMEAQGRKDRGGPPQDAPPTKSSTAPASTNKPSKDDEWYKEWEREKGANKTPAKRDPNAPVDPNAPDADMPVSSDLGTDLREPTAAPAAAPAAPKSVDPVVHPTPEELAAAKAKQAGATPAPAAAEVPAAGEAPKAGAAPKAGEAPAAGGAQPIRGARAPKDAETLKKEIAALDAQIKSTTDKKQLRNLKNKRARLAKKLEAIPGEKPPTADPNAPAGGEGTPSPRSGGNLSQIPVAGNIATGLQSYGGQNAGWPSMVGYGPQGGGNGAGQGGYGQGGDYGHLIQQIQYAGQALQNGDVNSATRAIEMVYNALHQEGVGGHQKKTLGSRIKGAVKKVATGLADAN